VKSPFALIQEIRQWFDGPLALSGSIASGDAVLAAQAMGADFAYIGSAFIATHEARASDAYKQAIVDSNSDDIVYSNLFTGVHGNYLASRQHPRRRHGPGQPARERPQQDELWWRRERRPRPGRTSGAAARALARYKAPPIRWHAHDCSSRPGRPLFRDLGSPAKLACDSAAQRVGRTGLAVHHIDLVRCLRQGAQPGQQLIGIGVG
jgi:hypothetical protein